jgi:hypothetical protein
MRIIVGLLLIIVCFLGTIFFSHYNGTVIAYPILWYVSFVILGSLGMWLISSSIRKAKRVINQVVGTQLEKLKSNAEKIELDFDKCEFKSGSFSDDVDDPNISTIKLFAPGSAAFIETKTTETVIQSYLTYTGIINSTVCKFVSQSFPFDKETLKYYVNNHNIALYVDRFNREKYLFELER